MTNSFRRERLDLPMTQSTPHLAGLNRIAIRIAAYAQLLIATTAFGHGNPVHVSVSDHALVVTGGWSIAQGFAGQAWDSHEDAALDAASGNRLTSTYPGYDVNGMDPSASLRLEVISRPDYTAPNNPDRWLWYWNTSASVTSVPANARFDAVSLFVAGSNFQLQQAALVAGPTATMANQIGPFMNSHAHLLSYQLQNASASQPGVYAFFARLTSPGLDPSEPFLLAFRNQTSVDFFAQAVTDINKAAVPSGDYNFDDIVNAADYVVWRKTAGSDEQYEAWRENFAAIILPPGSSPSEAENAAVPEPDAVLLLALTSAIVAIGRRRVRVPPTRCGCQRP